MSSITTPNQKQFLIFAQGTFFKGFSEKISAILRSSIMKTKINQEVTCKRNHFGYWNLCKGLPKFRKHGSPSEKGFQLPVPKSFSTKSSQTIGSSLLSSGWSTLLPCKWEYLSSVGWTATAVSPSIVSRRVVDTLIFSSESWKYPSSMFEHCDHQSKVVK